MTEHEKELSKLPKRYLSYKLCRGEQLKSGSEKTLTSNDSIVISALGTDTKVLKDFVDAAVVNSMVKDEGKIGIYEKHRWGIGWNKAQSKKARGMDSVVLDQDLAQELVEDIQRF